ncbi:MAG: replication-relaxation family protein [Chloroflexota bacterium]|nr:replication-relaxation family protein [Chloroflexota bacterium]
MSDRATFWDARRAIAELTPDGTRVLVLLAQAPLLWTDAVCTLAPLGSRATAYRCLEKLRGQGLVGQLRSRQLGSGAPQMYHLTDLGVAVVASMRGLDAAHLAMMHRLRGEDLATRLKGLPHLSSLYELATALVPPGGSLGHWLAPWTGRYFKPTVRALQRVSLPAYIEIRDDRDRTTPYLLLPDDGSRELYTYKATLVRLGEYIGFRGELPNLIVATTHAPRADEWKELLNEPRGDGRARRLPGCVFTWDEVAEGLTQSITPRPLSKSHAQPIAVRRASPEGVSRKVPELVSRGLRGASSLDLSPDDGDLLELIARHPFLSTDDIACVLDWSPDKVSRTRRRLLTVGLLREPREGELGTGIGHGLTEVTNAGLGLVAARVGLTPADATAMLGLSGGGPQEPFGQRQALARDTAHTLGVNALFVGLYRVAAAWRQAGNEYSVTNWLGALGRASRGARPDGHAEFWAGDVRYAFTLEYDRGTEGEAQLVWKFDGYRRLYAKTTVVPSLTVLVVTTDAVREERVARAILTAYAGRGASLPVLITTEERVQAERDGLLASIWREPASSRRRHWLKRPPGPVPYGYGRPPSEPYR